MAILSVTGLSIGYVTREVKCDILWQGDEEEEDVTLDDVTNVSICYKDGREVKNHEIRVT